MKSCVFVFAFLLVACGARSELWTPDGATVRDGGSIAPDAGSAADSVPEADATPVVDAGTDAGSPIELEIQPSFTGADTGLGTPDVQINFLRFTAPRHTLEFRRLLVRIDGVDGAMVRGTGGTPFATDIKFVDVFNGSSVLGPITIPSSVAPGATTTGMMSFPLGDTWGLPVGTSVNLATTLDLAAHEDVAGEFTVRNGRGGSYHVWVGMQGSSLVDPSDVQIVGGDTLRPEQIAGVNVASYGTLRIYPVPTLTVEEYFPVIASNILTVHGSVWTGQDGYRLCANGGDILVHALGVQALGERRTYTGFGLWVPPDTIVAASTRTWDGDGTDATIQFATPTRIADGTCLIADIGAQFAPVAPRSRIPLSGAYSLSGDHAGTALGEGPAVGWREYADHLRIRATDGAGHSVYAIGHFATREFVIRRSQPTIVELPPVALVARNGERVTLKRFRISSDTTDPIGWIQQSWIVNGDWSAGACLGGFQMLRGSDPMAPADVRFYDDSGNELSSDAACYHTDGDAFNHVTVRFTDVQMASLSGGEEYALTAMPRGFANSNTIATNYTRFSSTIPITGRLVEASHGLRGIQVVDAWSGPTDVIATPAFLWTDFSDHSVGVSSSSVDWTDEVWVSIQPLPRTLVLTF